MDFFYRNEKSQVFIGYDEKTLLTRLLKLLILVFKYGRSGRPKKEREENLEIVFDRPFCCTFCCCCTSLENWGLSLERNNVSFKDIHEKYH